MTRSSGKVRVLNYSSPELDWAAAAIDEEGLLESYFRRAHLPRLLAQDSPLGHVRYPGDAVIANRSLPTSRLARRTTSPASYLEVAGLLWNRLNPGRTPADVAQLHRRMRSTLARRAATQRETEVASILGGMHVSAETFSTTDALRIYNFPIIHPQYMLDLALRETETEPDFSRFWAKDAERALGDERLMAEIELADHVLVGSHFAKQTFVLQGFPDDAISVIPYGVDTRKFSPGPRNKRETPRCLFVGGINQRKGLSYLMHAARLARESVQFNLVLIGSGSLPQAMEEYDGEYEFLGTMSHRLLHREFKQADLFVFPTLAEGLGLVALEAMASGVPVLTSPYGPNEVVRDGVDGIVIEPRDTERMADAWVRVLLDDELRYRMAVSARERAESFSWRAYQTRLLQALHSMS